MKETHFNIVQIEIKIWKMPALDTGSEPNLNYGFNFNLHIDLKHYLIVIK